MSLSGEQPVENRLEEGVEKSKLLPESTSPGKSLSANTPVKIQKAQSYSSSNGPTLTALNPASSSAQALITQQSLDGGGGCSANKPVLIRQDRTTNSSYLASPQLSTLGTSEETSDDDAVKTISYQLIPSGPKCRTCNLNERRRASVSPSTVINNAGMLRCGSKESIARLSPSAALLQSSSPIPPVYVTGSPVNSSLNSSRVIRQSSQPESSVSCCMQQTSSLRQLRDVSDPIAGIATETLRVRAFESFMLCCWGSCGNCVTGNYFASLTDL